MYSIRLITATLFVALMMLISSPANAELKYQQDLTFTTWESQEKVEEQVREFCNAAAGDPDIKIIGVKFEQKKYKKTITYNAIMTCYVSKIDQDFIRISGKVFQQKNGLADNASATTPPN